MILANPWKQLEIMRFDFSSLGTITIPSSIALIGDYALHSFSALDIGTIGESVLEIRGCAFYSYSSLKELSQFRVQSH